MIILRCLWDPSRIWNWADLSLSCSYPNCSILKLPLYLSNLAFQVLILNLLHMKSLLDINNSLLCHICTFFQESNGPLVFLVQTLCNLKLASDLLVSDFHRLEIMPLTTVT